MSLPPGTRIGHYEILGLIGKGGMGEVFRARDLDLGREVAVKTLPAAFAQDPERLTRFEREARLLASLNHPHIATIHGFERSGEMRFLVLELISGETLADTLRRGPMAVHAALEVFRQIAAALEAAHEGGVVHRDLKPANVKVTPEGTVKVLDFGLAKALSTESEAGGASSELATKEPAPTGAGVILGTAPYMSPEQVRGKVVDRRTDVWAFGCVLFEALTGESPFMGETFSDTAAAILGREPDWALLPAATPSRVRELLRRSLQKDSTRRLRDMGDARLEIEDALSEPVVPEAPRRRRPSWSAGALGLAAGAFISALVLMRRDSPTPQRPVRFTIEAPTGTTFSLEPGLHVALSPLGTHAAFAARGEDGRSRIYVRAFDRLEAAPLAGTEGGFYPFFSPDGRFLGFFTASKLKKVALDGGPPLSVADVPPVTRGGSWAPDDTFIVSPSFAYGLSRIPAGGGVPTEFARTDPGGSRFGYLWPQVLPGGKAVLFTIWTGVSFDEAKVAVLSLASNEPRILEETGCYARYVSSGHIVFARGGSLIAVPFDLNRLEVTGSPVSVLDGVLTRPETGGVSFEVSDNGTLAYVPATDWASRPLVWMERDGTREVSSLKRQWNVLRLSPDARQLAVQIGNDIWIYEVERDSLRRLTFDGISNYPVWSPDGKRVAYAMVKATEPQLHVRPADGSGEAKRLTKDVAVEFPNSWAPDGSVLAYARTTGPKDDWDVFVVPADGSGDPKPLLAETFSEVQPAFSPDGRFIAYVSNESGRYEVYARRYPGLGAKWQISTEGGGEPLWSPNGREIFYHHQGNVVVVPVQAGDQLSPGKPRVLLKMASRGTAFQPGFTNYGVTPDGRRFVAIGPNDPARAPRRIYVTLNWLEELKRIVRPSR